VRDAIRALIAAGLVAGSGGCIINGGHDAPLAQFEVGAPDPVGFGEVPIEGIVRGAVKHDVCVSANVATGYVVPTDLFDDLGAIGPDTGAPLQSTPFADLDCPTTGIGWARIVWYTVTGRGLLTLQYSTSQVDAPPQDLAPFVDAGEVPDAGDWFEPDAGDWFEPDADVFAPDADPFAPDAGFFAFSAGAQTLLEGVAFEGYDVTAGDPSPITDSSSTWSLPLHADYRPAGDLAASPVANVTVRMVWPDFFDPSLILGGSPGVGQDYFTSDVRGDAYLLLSADAFCNDYTMFGTTPDGGTTLVTTLGCP
jgi:hypothetical protein